MSALTYESRDAIVATNGWAGRIEHAVRVIGETPKRYRITSRDGKAYTFAANRKLRDGDKLTREEREILSAQYLVEKMGADPLLTEVTTLLTSARSKLADYVDKILEQP